jgi:hypothetical protein
MLFRPIAYVYCTLFLSILHASEYEPQPTRRRTLTQSHDHQPPASCASVPPTPIVSVLYAHDDSDNFTPSDLHEVTLDFNLTPQTPIKPPQEQETPAPILAPRRSLITGLTPLMRACLNGTENQVKQLIQASSESVNKTAQNGNNALMWLFSNAKNITHALAITKELCAARIDLDHRNNLGETALIILLKHTYNQQQQVHAYQILSFLIIEKEVSINAYDKTGTTALMHATGSKNIPAIELLLQRNAEVAASNQEKKSFHTILNSADTPLEIKNLWYKKYHAIYMAIESKNQDIKKMAEAYFNAQFPQFGEKNPKSNIIISKIITSYVA